MAINLNLSLGAIQKNEHCHFTVWAPFTDEIVLKITKPKSHLEEYTLYRNENNYFDFDLEGDYTNACYQYCFNKKCYSDPASRYQPLGINGPSQIIKFDHATYWQGLALNQYIIYELHVGTFTKDGSFASIIPMLDYLAELGITAIELMPIAQFSGQRNWGYDAVLPFSIQNSYGTSDEFKKLIQACHARNIAVILDVIYNHLGPEGNYFNHFGPYFTDKYKTPWGLALNFDGPFSDDVRRYFIENALHWFIEYDIDALRLDAVHAIYDASAYPFLAELSDHVQALKDKINKPIYLIAESNLNDTRIIDTKTIHGFGIDAQWNDDFHHALHTLLTKEKSHYYQDFGELFHLAKAFREGFVYDGQYSSFRKCRHGNSSNHIPADQFIVFMQNHDQIGNRPSGDRLSVHLTFAALKLAAGLTILSPFIPLIFMGEEYAEVAPFIYFINHADPALIDATRAGRIAEFNLKPEELIDPQLEDTFLRCKLNHDLKQKEHHKTILSYYQALIHLRKKHPIFSELKKDLDVKFHQENKSLLIPRKGLDSEVLIVCHFNAKNTVISFPKANTIWNKIFDSNQFMCDESVQVAPNCIDINETTLELAPYSFVIYERKMKHE